MAMLAGERKIYLLFSPVSGLMLYVEYWQAVDGILFQFVNGTGVFLGVFQTAMTEKAGNGLDVGYCPVTRASIRNRGDGYVNSNRI